jgi:hypothetical protein
MNIPEKITLIKTRMPDTYKTIQDKAKVIGNDAYALVKRGLRGEPNCFWAMEAGNVVGTPFNHTEISRDVAQSMVTFGSAHVCIFAMLESEVQRGSN